MYNPKTFIKPDLTEIFTTVRLMHEYIEHIGKQDEFIEYLTQKGLEAKKPRKTLAESNSPVHRLYSIFCQFFLELTGTSYPGSIGKDMSLLKQILDTQGGNENVVHDLMGIYFEDASRGAFYKDRLSVGHMRTFLPQLVIRYQEERAKSGK